MRLIKTTICLVLVWPCAGDALTFNGVASIALGQVEFATPLTGAVEMGTNAQKQYSGAFTGGANGTAGAIEIQDDPSTEVDISCTPAVLANAAGATMAAAVEVAAGATGRGAWGMSPACTDLATTALSHTLTASAPDNTLYFGLRIEPTSMTDGSYSTGNLNGQSISVRAVVH